MDWTWKRRKKCGRILFEGHVHVHPGESHGVVVKLGHDVCQYMVPNSRWVTPIRINLCTGLPVSISTLRSLLRATVLSCRCRRSSPLSYLLVSRYSSTRDLRIPSLGTSRGTSCEKFSNVAYCSTLCTHDSVHHVPHLILRAKTAQSNSSMFCL